MFVIMEKRPQNCLTKYIDPNDRGQLRLHKPQHFPDYMPIKQHAEQTCKQWLVQITIYYLSRNYMLKPLRSNTFQKNRAEHVKD
jgi:hypothetical protein